MVKGRRRPELVYSDIPYFNRRKFHIEIYVNNFESIVRVICKAEIEEARKRIKANKSKTFYRYTPSQAYLRALNKFHSHKK